LIRLAKSVLIHNVPRPFHKRPDLFHRALLTIKRLSWNGGEEYNRALQALRFAYSPINVEDFGRTIMVTDEKRNRNRLIPVKVYFDPVPYREALRALCVTPDTARVAIHNR
jgi:hypothetical protein